MTQCRDSFPSAAKAENWAALFDKGILGLSFDVWCGRFMMSS